MPTIDIAGLPVFYTDTGGEGPAVLFAHGFLMDHTMFDPQVEALADRYRCIRFDERGFGSTPAPGPFTYWDLAEDAVELLRALGVDRAVFVGMSQGGFLSLRAALAHPEMVGGLVLIDSQAGVDDPETLAGYRQMVDTWLSAGPVDELTSVVAGLIIGDPDKERPWIERWKRMPPENLRWPAECLLDRDDITDRLGEITCPVLVIHGTADAAIPLERARQVCEAVPDCRGLVTVEGAAHAPNITHPAEVNATLERFLAEVTGR